MSVVKAQETGNTGVRLQLYSRHEGKLQATQGSSDKSKALWGEAPFYSKLNKHHTYSPIVSVKHMWITDI